DGARKHVWTTSWGLSWRTIGAIIMVHGDDSGLIMPPKVAPIQAVIIPIPGKGGDDEAVRAAVDNVRSLLSERYRVKVDLSDKTPGWKYREWELRGVPVRIEIGPRDVRANQVVLVRRDTREKTPVSVADLPSAVGDCLERIHQSLYQRALALRESRTSTANSP